MRFFIALEIPEENKPEIEKIQQRVKLILPEIRISETEKLHLTIAFIGEQPDEYKQKLIDILTQASEGIPPFKVTPGYIDGFTNLHTPHTLWIGVKGDIDKLLIIRERIKDGLMHLSLPVDERRYTPHITIAKAPSSFVVDETAEKALQELMLEEYTPINISSIKLFESVAEGGQHRHKTLAELKLED